tara:strand:+ start:237 stop:563 length:327 start_codon:yes stop_codon:yes gene_type:complete
MHVTNINLASSGALDGNGNGVLTSQTTPKIKNINGGTYCFLASGAIPASGCTLTLQHKVGANYIDIGDDAVLTGPGGCVFTTSQSDIQLVIAGNNATANSIDVVIAPV